MEGQSFIGLWHPDRREPGFRATQHWTRQRMRLSLTERAHEVRGTQYVQQEIRGAQGHMEASPSPLSSRAQPRDLQFSGLVVEMFFAQAIRASRPVGPTAKCQP